MRSFVLLAFCLATTLRAQDPPGTEWRRIRTEHFDVIFPHGIEADAQRAANSLETLYAPLSQSLGASLPRHTVVMLANQTVTRYSGGYVSLFPRMATFNMMPAQGFWGTNDWITSLTATEGRRLVQIAKMNHGFGKVATTLNVSYNRFFPVLDLGFQDRDRSLQFSDHKETWTERTASAVFHVPLNLSRGYYVTGLSFAAAVESISLHGGGLTPLVYGFRFSRARQRAARDLAPMWAQTLRLTYGSD
jgi:hypothetical protein